MVVRSCEFESHPAHETKKAVQPVLNSLLFIGKPCSHLSISLLLPIANQGRVLSVACTEEARRYLLSLVYTPRSCSIHFSAHGGQ